MTGARPSTTLHRDHLIELSRRQQPWLDEEARRGGIEALERVGELLPDLVFEQARREGNQAVMDWPYLRPNGH